MTMERGQSGLRRMGDHDLASQLSGIKQEFARRHPSMRDIPLRGRLPGEPSRLHPFLEGKIRIEPWTIGGKDGQTLLGELAGRGVNGLDRRSYARSIVENPEFTTLPEPQQIEVGILKVGDMGIKKDYPTFAEIEARRDELGLEALPAEALLHYLLENGDKLQRGEIIVAGMKPIADSDGNPNVLNVERNTDGLWLNSNWANPDNKWNPDNQFAFSLRKCFLYRSFYRLRFFLMGIKIFLPTAKHFTYFIEFY